MRTIGVQVLMVAAYLALTVLAMYVARTTWNLFPWWVVGIGVISVIGYASGWLARDRMARRQSLR